MSNGITSILNSHYNSNIKNFEPNIESDNLKTVMLKIGEVDPKLSAQEWFESQEKYKQKRLKGIKKRLSTKAKIKLIQALPQSKFAIYPSFDPALDNWSNYKLLKTDQKGEITAEFEQPSEETISFDEIEKNYNKLKGLDIWFEKYTALRQVYFDKIWELQNGDKATIQSICKLTELKEEYLNPIDKAEHVNTEEGRKKENEGQKITNNADILHKFVQVHVAYTFDNLEFDKQFLANLWSDVATDYIGYIKSFVGSQKKLKDNTSDLVNFLQEFNITFNLKDNPYTFENEDQKFVQIAFSFLSKEFFGKTWKKPDEKHVNYTKLADKILNYAEYNLIYSKIKDAIFKLQSYNNNLPKNELIIKKYEESVLKIKKLVE